MIRVATAGHSADGTALPAGRTGAQVNSKHQWERSSLRTLRMTSRWWTFPMALRWRAMCRSPPCWRLPTGLAFTLLGTGITSASLHLAKGSTEPPLTWVWIYLLITCTSLVHEKDSHVDVLTKLGGLVDTCAYLHQLMTYRLRNCTYNCSAFHCLHTCITMKKYGESFLITQLFCNFAESVWNHGLH